MALKKIARKARIGAQVLKEDGILGLSIRSLQYTQKRVNSRKRRSEHQGSLQKVYVKAAYEDILEADFRAPRMPYRTTKAKQLIFNWLMPPPGRGSGGHINIFRFIKYLEEAGHICNIYLCLEGASGNADALRTVMDGYPVVQAANHMQWLHPHTEMAEADGIFATSWETAYASFNADTDAKRFYFVQDFEPYFYPIGGLYALAENTYRFGFYGITAGGWLSKKLHADYGMRTTHYDFGADESLYSLTNTGSRKEIFFYARPYTERRGFELGIIALDLFHRMHPDYIINFAGWDVSDYDIPFPYNNLRTLDLDELNGVYNRCAAGLILSFTNMSLLPLEVMKSGMIPVVNDADNNRLVSDNKYIAYSPGDPASLAKTLSEIVSRKDLPSYAKKASESVSASTWDDAGKVFVSAVEKEVRTHV